jgi:hypothetical protein
MVMLLIIAFENENECVSSPASFFASQFLSLLFVDTLVIALKVWYRLNYTNRIKEFHEKWDCYFTEEEKKNMVNTSYAAKAKEAYIATHGKERFHSRFELEPGIELPGERCCYCIDYTRPCKRCCRDVVGINFYRKYFWLDKSDTPIVRHWFDDSDSFLRGTIVSNDDGDHPHQGSGSKLELAENGYTQNPLVKVEAKPSPAAAAARPVSVGVVRGAPRPVAPRPVSVSQVRGGSLSVAQTMVMGDGHQPPSCTGGGGGGG